MVSSKMIPIIPFLKRQIRSIAVAALHTSNLRDYMKPYPFEPVGELLKLGELLSRFRSAVLRLDWI